MISFWIACSMLNATIVMIRQLQEPVSGKAYRQALWNNILLGPISTIGGVFFIAYMMRKAAR